jgi:hypothetical protein
MRLNLAPTSALTDARGNNEKARNLTAWQRQVRAVVGLPNKPTGACAQTPAPVTSSTHPGERTTSKLAFPLLPCSLGRSTYGANNERPTLRDSSSGNRGSY